MRFHLASEAAHVLNEDGSHTIVFDAIQECDKAWTILDSIGSTYGRVVKFIDYSITVPLRERDYCRSLTLQSVLVFPDI
jgi:hypothetical protein